jgi:hypothetical protein
MDPVPRPDPRLHLITVRVAADDTLVSNTFTVCADSLANAIEVGRRIATAIVGGLPAAVRAFSADVSVGEEPELLSPATGVAGGVVDGEVLPRP